MSLFLNRIVFVLKEKKYFILSVFFIFFILSFLLIQYFFPERKEAVKVISNSVNLSKSEELQLKPVTLKSIFSDNHNFDYINPKDKITLIATGDIIPARVVNYKTTAFNNFNWPYEKTADFLKSADITFINLEAPLLEKCPRTNEGMVFCGDQGNINGLVFAGVDVANLANNHTNNYGVSGVNETIDSLNKLGILASGINPIYKEVKGIKFAFLGYDELEYQNKLLTELENKIIKDLRETKKEADIVIVQFHWGTEYTIDITDNQKNLAHLAIDNGADLIIGNHPHWIQPVEIYQGKLIVYAHGNFVFDQEWSKETKEGVVGKYTFYKNKLIDAEFFPVKIINYGQPYFLSGNYRKQILSKMKNNSENLSKIKL